MSDDVDWELRGREIAEVTAALRSVLADFPVASDASRVGMVASPNA